MNARSYAALFAVSTLGMLVLGALAVALGIAHASSTSEFEKAIFPLTASAAGAALIVVSGFRLLRVLYGVRLTARRRTRRGAQMVKEVGSGTVPKVDVKNAASAMASAGVAAGDGPPLILTPREPEFATDLDARRASRWTLLFVIGIAAIVLFAFLSMNWLLEHEWLARGYLAIFVLWTLGTMLHIHWWSLARFRELSKRYAREGRNCDYCQEANHLIVCSKCRSIQWETLRIWKGTVAVFVSHYRWKLLTPVLSVGVVGALAFGADLEVKLWQRRAAAQVAHDTQARAVIDATTSVRGALIQLAAFCGTQEMTDSKCQEQFRIVLNDYPRLSWHAPPLLADLMKARCSAGSPNKACPLLKKLEKQAEDQEKQAEDQEKQAKGQKKKPNDQKKKPNDLIGCMDNSYRRVVDAFTDFTDNSLTDNDRKRWRCESAKTLYYHGRRLSCVISWLSFGPDPEDPGHTMFTECGKLLSEATKLLSEGTCEKPLEPSDETQVVWSTWGCDRPLLDCDDSRGAYKFLRAGKVHIHQDGTTSYGKGDHPDIRITLCVEGPHHECWVLPEGSAMNDVLDKEVGPGDTLVDKEVGPGDTLVLWHDEGGGGRRVHATNCDFRTQHAIFQQGGTGASFVVDMPGSPDPSPDAL